GAGDDGPAARPAVASGAGRGRRFDAVVRDHAQADSWRVHRHGVHSPLAASRLSAASGLARGRRGLDPRLRRRGL
ncbi:MAG: hypothetical protein AVDCRST_MAG69-1600, partial [uncultured Solirubrobacteraceae bacterium]